MLKQYILNSNYNRIKLQQTSQTRRISTEVNVINRNQTDSPIMLDIVLFWDVQVFRIKKQYQVNFPNV